MPKPTITPSARILQEAQETTTVTDSKGRKITYRKLDALDKMKLYSILGAEDAKNESVLVYALYAYMTTEIDGTPYVTPSNRLQLDAMVKRLDDEGCRAIIMQYVADKQAEDIETEAKN